MHLKLDTIMLFVADTEMMKDFYHKLLGCTILEEIPSEWILLSAGAAKIGLHKIGTAYTASQNSSATERNSKIIFETEEDIHQLHAMLLTKGVSVNEITSFDQYPYLLFMGHDPEGNVFQIIQKNNFPDHTSPS